MTCIWQQKATKLLDDAGNFDAAKAREHFGHGHGLGQVGRPSDAGGGRNARQTAELTNAIQKFFIEESRLGIPVDLSRRMSARSGGDRRDQLFAADRPGGDVRSGPRASGCSR